MLGNAPFGFYREAYSKRLQESLSHCGQKVFVYKALLEEDSGRVEPVEGKASDFAWLTREDMEKRLHPRTFRAIDDTLHDEC